MYWVLALIALERSGLYDGLHEMCEGGDPRFEEMGYHKRSLELEVGVE